MRPSQNFFVIMSFCSFFSGSLAAGSEFHSLLSDTTNSLTAASSSAGFWFIFLAFLAGILTSLLPCIYPMIPITLGIIQGQGAKTLWRNFQLTFAYTNGLALVYAMLGYISATSAVLFGSWLGKPWFIIAAAMIFIYFAGAMLGFYELYIPTILQSPKMQIEGGSVTYCFVLGMLSALVVSPCLAPPLVVLLGLVAKQANPLLGFISLYAFSLGISMFLLVVGTFSGVLMLLPRAGEWLDYVKQVLGFCLLAVAVYFLQPLVGVRVLLGLYASVLLAAIWFFAHKVYVYQSRQGAVLWARMSLVVAFFLTAACGLYFRTIFLRLMGMLS